MRTLALLGIMLIGCSSALAAEDFRMGVTGAAEFNEPADCDDFLDELWENADLFPGVYWEVIHQRFGFGMTCLGRFLHEEIPGGRIWTFDWITTCDLRYHFFKKFFIDPFAEAGFGCAGSVRFSGLIWDDENIDVMGLSLFAQVGVGVGVRLEGFHAGVKILCRVWNSPVPGTDFAEYPLRPFEGAIFAGVSF